MNKFLLAVPAFCDFVASTLQYISLNFISGSVYQMMRGGTITTFVFYIVFLKVKVKKVKSGDAFLLLLELLIGLSNMDFSSSDPGSADAVKHSFIIHCKLQGISSSSFHFFFQWVLLLFEQKLLNKYHLEPLQVVRYEGLFDLTFYVFLIPIILTLIPCSFGQAACVFSHSIYPFI